MNMFWRRCEGRRVLTKDPILREYKFTNVYRSCDRVSQYLIRHVIYENIEDYTPEDMLLRILVFKIFNKIGTWEYLMQSYGDITINHFDVKEISSLLSDKRGAGVMCLPVCWMLGAMSFMAKCFQVRTGILTWYLSLC